MKKLLLATVIVAGFVMLGTLSASAATLNVVSDPTVSIVGVYNKAGGPTNYVDRSSSPLGAVRAQEPKPYPTGYVSEPPETTNSIWDTNVNWSFQTNAPTADWIWETQRAEDPVTVYTVSDPLYDADASTHGRVVVFQKDFIVNGIPQTGSVLDITADNGWEVYVNGNWLGRSATAAANWATSTLHESSLATTGWQTVSHVSIPASMLQYGMNTIKILAGNEYFAGDDDNSPTPPLRLSPYYQYNPGALIFNLNVSYEPATCTTTTLISDNSTQNAGYIENGIAGDPAATPLNSGLYSAPGWQNSVVLTSPVISPGLWVDPATNPNFSGSGAKWISTADGNNGNDNNYVPDAWRLYKAGFNLPAGAFNIAANMNVTADNAFSVYLNDSSTAIGSSGSVYGTAPYTSNPPPFYDTSKYYFNNVYSYGLSPSIGNNILNFVVRNWDANGSPSNPTGLLYKAIVSYCAPNTPPAVPLKVTKTANASYDRTWNWTIDKTGSTSTLTLAAGEIYKVDYTIDLNATSVDSDWAVSGTIAIENPNSVDANITGVNDVLGTVDCGVGVTFPHTLAAGGTLNCTYSGSLPNSSNTTNEVTVTTSGDVPGNTATAAVTFGNPNEIHKCVKVSDTYPTSTVTGNVCANDSLPKIFEYSRDLGPYDIGTYTVDNTASFVTIDEPTVTGDSSWTVSVNVPVTGCTLTQGYWKTHNATFMGGAPIDPNWSSINPSAENSPFFLSGSTWSGVFWTAPKGNAYYNLADQYMAAVLNQNNGASLTLSVSNAINSATTLFNTYTPAQVAASKGSSTYRAQFINLAGILGNYNEGLIGPGHCSE